MCRLDIKRAEPNKLVSHICLNGSLKRKRECQMRLIYYRAKELPPYHNIILAECIKVNKL